jgi:hypothetical protein
MNRKTPIKIPAIAPSIIIRASPALLQLVYSKLLAFNLTQYSKVAARAT